MIIPHDQGTDADHSWNGTRDRDTGPGHGTETRDRDTGPGQRTGTRHPDWGDATDRRGVWITEHHHGRAVVVVHQRPEVSHGWRQHPLGDYVLPRMGVALQQPRQSHRAARRRRQQNGRRRFCCERSAASVLPPVFCHQHLQRTQVAEAWRRSRRLEYCNGRT